MARDKEQRLSHPLNAMHRFCLDLSAQSCAYPMATVASLLALATMCACAAQQLRLTYRLGGRDQSSGDYD
jgi:hypothetical protein